MTQSVLNTTARESTIELSNTRLPNASEIELSLGAPPLLSFTKSADFTAEIDGVYVTTASLTVTDPTPTQGFGYTVHVRNGTSTIGGTAYVAGQVVRRIFHSGAWGSTVIAALGVAQTFSALQTFNAGLTVSSGTFAAQAVTCTTLSATGQITSTLATGTAPLVVASTTNVANLNASSLNGATFASPGAIGGTTPAAISCTTMTASGKVTSNSTAAGSITASGDIYLQKGTGTDAQLLLQVSGFGSIQFGCNNSGSTNATGAPTGAMYFGSNGSFPMYLTQGGAPSLSFDTGRVATFAGTVNVTGSVPGTPGATEVLIGGGQIKAGAGIACVGLTVSASNIVTDTTTGTKVATATGQKLGFWNAAPIIQPASANQAAVAGTAATNIAPYGFTTAAQADAIVTLVNQLRSDLVAAGLIKGAA